MITQNTVVLLERALRPLGVPLKPYEECKRGAAGACLSLLKRLLFHTSSQVASQVAARHAGSLNSLSDRKVVLLAFDILRELSRFSPPLTPEQFMSKSSYGEQKIKILTRLAEHVLVYFDVHGAVQGGTSLGGVGVHATLDSQQFGLVAQSSSFIYSSLPTDTQTSAVSFSSSSSPSIHSTPAPAHRQSIGHGSNSNGKRSSFSVPGEGRRVDSDDTEMLTNLSSSPLATPSSITSRPGSNANSSGGKFEIADQGLHELGVIGEDLKLQLLRVLSPHQKNQLSSILGQSNGIEASEKDTDGQDQDQDQDEDGNEQSDDCKKVGNGRRKGSKGTNSKRVGNRLRQKPRKDSTISSSSVASVDANPVNSSYKSSYIPFAVDLSLGGHFAGPSHSQFTGFRSDLSSWMKNLLSSEKANTSMSTISTPIAPAPPQSQAISAASPANSQARRTSPSKPTMNPRRGTFFFTSNEDEEDENEDGEDEGSPEMKNINDEFGRDLERDSQTIHQSHQIQHNHPTHHFGDALLQRLEKRLAVNLETRIAESVKVCGDRIEKKYQNYLVQLAEEMDQRLNVLTSRICAIENIQKIDILEDRYL